jgi:hypothetical protein
VNSFLLLQKDDLVEMVSKPHEDARLQVPCELFLGTINEMKEAVQGCVYHLVGNLNEIVVSEWKGRVSKKVERHCTG